MVSSIGFHLPTCMLKVGEKKPTTSCMISSRQLLSRTDSPVKHLSSVLERIIYLPQLLLIPFTNLRPEQKLNWWKISVSFHPWSTYTFQKTIFWGDSIGCFSNFRLQNLNHFINNVQDRDMSKVTQAGS